MTIGMFLAAGCGDDLRGAPLSPGPGGGMPDGGTGSGNSGSNGSEAGNDGGGSTDAPNPFPRDPAGGEFAWVVSTAGAFGPVVAVDRDGNIAIAATQNGEVTLGTVHLAAPRGEAVLVLKLTSDGKPVWGRSFPLAGSAEAQAITVTSEGDVVIGGQFRGGPLQVGDQQMISAGNGDGFVIALEGTAGVQRWAAQRGSANDYTLADHVAGLVSGPDADGVEAIFAYEWLGSNVQFVQSGSYLIRYNRDDTQRWVRSFANLDSPADSDLSSRAQAIDAESEPRPKLRFVITEVTTQLTLTDCTLGPEDCGEVQDGIWTFEGSLVLTRSALSGILSRGIVLQDMPNVSTDLQVLSLALDHVNIEADDVGIQDL